MALRSSWASAPSQLPLILNDERRDTRLVLVGVMAAPQQVGCAVSGADVSLGVASVAAILSVHVSPPTYAPTRPRGPLVAA